VSFSESAADSVVGESEASSLEEKEAKRSLLDVRLDCFEGPIDLLLELISRRKLEINAVSVARVVDDFVLLVEQNRENTPLSLEEMTKFLLVAATLLRMKTARLLPTEPSIEVDEELLVDAERDILLARLLAARTFAEVSEVLREQLEEGIRYVPRAVQSESHFRWMAPDLLAQITPDDLAGVAFKILLGRPGPELILDHVLPVKASVKMAFTALCEVLLREGVTSFSKVCVGCSSAEIVVRFLALLELVKMGMVAAVQDAPLADITLRWIGPEGDDSLVWEWVEEWDEELSVTDLDLRKRLPSLESGQGEMSVEASAVRAIDEACRGVGGDT